MLKPHKTTLIFSAEEYYLVRCIMDRKRWNIITTIREAVRLLAKQERIPAWKHGGDTR